MDSKSLIRTIIEDRGSVHFSKGCKKIYRELYEEICENTQFLNDFNPRIIDRVNHYINGITELNRCIECCTVIPRLNATFCSKKCMDNSEYLKKKKEETNLKKFGATNVSKSDHFKIQYKSIMNEKYGVDHYSQTAEYKEKYKNTSILRYGETNPSKSESIKRKVEETNLKKYGTKTPLLNDEIKGKTLETLNEKYHVSHNSQIEGRYEKMQIKSLENFGVEHPMQNAEIFEKCMSSSYRFKDYIFPSGKLVRIQGYENIALDKLLESFGENDLVVGAKEIKKLTGVIQYVFEGTNKIYHPDIYIISENTIVEVKSTYTITVDVEKNEAKRQAVLNKGIGFTFMIF